LLKFKIAALDADTTMYQGSVSYGGKGFELKHSSLSMILGKEKS
jgi:hypothetical protein